MGKCTRVEGEQGVEHDRGALYLRVNPSAQRTETNVVGWIRHWEDVLVNDFGCELARQLEMRKHIPFNLEERLAGMPFAAEAITDRAAFVPSHEEQMALNLIADIESKADLRTAYCNKWQQEQLERNAIIKAGNKTAEAYRARVVKDCTLHADRVMKLFGELAASMTYASWLKVRSYRRGRIEDEDYLDYKLARATMNWIWVFEAVESTHIMRGADRDPVLMVERRHRDLEELRALKQGEEELSQFLQKFDDQVYVLKVLGCPLSDLAKRMALVRALNPGEFGELIRTWSNAALRKCLPGSFEDFRDYVIVTHASITTPAAPMTAISTAVIAGKDSNSHNVSSIPGRDDLRKACINQCRFQPSWGKKNKFPRVSFHEKARSRESVENADKLKRFRSKESERDVSEDMTACVQTQVSTSTGEKKVRSAQLERINEKKESEILRGEINPVREEVKLVESSGRVMSELKSKVNRYKKNLAETKNQSEMMITPRTKEEHVLQSTRTGVPLELTPEEQRGGSGLHGGLTLPHASRKESVNASEEEVSRLPLSSLHAVDECSDALLLNSTGAELEFSVAVHEYGYVCDVSRGGVLVLENPMNDGTQPDRDRCHAGVFTRNWSILGGLVIEKAVDVLEQCALHLPRTTEGACRVVVDDDVICELQKTAISPLSIASRSSEVVSTVLCTLRESFVRQVIEKPSEAELSTDLCTLRMGYVYETIMELNKAEFLSRARLKTPYCQISPSPEASENGQMIQLCQSIFNKSRANREEFGPVKDGSVVETAYLCDKSEELSKGFQKLDQIKLRCIILWDSQAQVVKEHREGKCFPEEITAEKYTSGRTGCGLETLDQAKHDLLGEMRLHAGEWGALRKSEVLWHKESKGLQHGGSVQQEQTRNDSLLRATAGGEQFNSLEGTGISEDAYAMEVVGGPAVGFIFEDDVDEADGVSLVQLGTEMVCWQMSGRSSALLSERTSLILVILDFAGVSVHDLWTTRDFGGDIIRLLRMAAYTELYSNDIHNENDLWAVCYTLFAVSTRDQFGTNEGDVWRLHLWADEKCSLLLNGAVTNVPVGYSYSEVGRERRSCGMVSKCHPEYCAKVTAAEDSAADEALFSFLEQGVFFYRMAWEFFLIGTLFIGRMMASLALQILLASATCSVYTKTGRLSIYNSSSATQGVCRILRGVFGV